jgi:hypothetical protein
VLPRPGYQKKIDTSMEAWPSAPLVLNKHELSWCLTGAPAPLPLPPSHRRYTRREKHSPLRLPPSPVRRTAWCPSHRTYFQAARPQKANDVVSPGCCSIAADIRILIEFEPESLADGCYAFRCRACDDAINGDHIGPAGSRRICTSERGLSATIDLECVAADTLYRRSSSARGALAVVIIDVHTGC